MATDMCTSTKVVTVDGVGAYDHISRKCMFDGLLAPLIPLVRLFYGGDSEYLFCDASGAAHSVLQSEGGEQGDLLMPGLFAFGFHQALRVAHASFQPGEDLFAFLDDTCISCPAHANIAVHLSKTKVWNSGGVEPVGSTDWVPADPDRPPAWRLDPPGRTTRHGGAGHADWESCLCGGPLTIQIGSPQDFAVQSPLRPRLAGRVVVAPHVRGTPLSLPPPRSPAGLHCNVHPSAR